MHSLGESKTKKLAICDDMAKLFYQRADHGMTGMQFLETL